LRGDAEPEGLADGSSYLTPKDIHGKVRCHPSMVTDVTIEATPGVPPPLPATEHLIIREAKKQAVFPGEYIHGRESGKK
jgi:hypothetical protein